MAAFIRGPILAATVMFVLVLLSGCTTTAAKKAMNKPVEDVMYSGFDDNEQNRSDRRAKNKKEPVSDDMKPDQAIAILVDHLRRKELHYSIPAEGQLRYWGTKQGVPEIIVRHVRELLKPNNRIEVRAPALRLTILYGKHDSIGDLIEVLPDPDYGMRSTAFKALKSKTSRDFGYNPSGGELARLKALQQWRQWWQDDRRTHLAQQAPLPAIERDNPPQIVTAGKDSEKVLEGKIEGDSQTKAVPEEILLPPPEEDPATKPVKKTARQ